MKRRSLVRISHSLSPCGQLLIKKKTKNVSFYFQFFMMSNLDSFVILCTAYFVSNFLQVMGSYFFCCLGGFFPPIGNLRLLPCSGSCCSSSWSPSAWC
jgi:hypothetical protein